jgi:hypothetical protein
VKCVIYWVVHDMHNLDQMTPQVFSTSQISGRISVKFALWFLALILAMLGSTGMLNDYAKLCWCITTYICFAAVLESHFLPPLTLILLFNFLFCIYSIPHVWFEVDLVSIPIKEGLPFLTQCNWIIALFISCLTLWISKDTKKRIETISYTKLCDRQQILKAPEVFYLLLVATILVIIFGIRGNVVLGIEGGYDVYMNNLSGGSGIQEYLLVPFFVAGLLIRTRFQRILWYIVISFFIIKLSLLGLRVVALMGMIMALWFSRIDISFKRMVYFFVFGYIIVSFLGLLKGGMGSEEVLTSLFFEMHGESVVSHHSNVLWASSAMLKLIDLGVIDVYRRSELLFYYLANTLIPSGFLQGSLGQISLGSWLQEKGYSSGGGHAAVYSFVAAGIPGVLVFSSLLGWSINRSISTKSDILSNGIRCWVMMTFITFPRWISYDIGNFYFRLPLYAAIVFIFLVSMRRHSTSKKQNPT